MTLMNEDKAIRIQKIKNILPIKYFHEPAFDTNQRSKILEDLQFSKSILDNNSFFKNFHILKKEEERHLFRKYNYLKYRIFKLTFKPSLNFLRESGLKEIEKSISNMNNVREVIIKCNTRLLVKPVSKFFANDTYDRDEFICNSCLHMIKAIDYFDYRLGFKFSTYYINVLTRNLVRDRNYLQRDTKGIGVSFDETNKKTEDYREINENYNKDFIANMLKELDKKFDKKKSTVIKKAFGVCGHKKQTLEEIGSQLKLTKERIRQIRDQSVDLLKKLDLVYDPVA